MDKKSHKLLWTLLAICLLLGAAWQFYPLPTAQGRFNRIPIVGPAFTGQEVPLSANEEKFFNHVNLIKRVYKVDDREFFITMLDGSHNRHVVHDPYYCFRGGGWSIDNAKPFKLPLGEAKLVEISKNDVKREALYWFSDGKENFTSPMRYWWDTTLRRVSLGASGQEPILIMVQPLDDKNVDWNKVINILEPVFK